MTLYLKYRPQKIADLDLEEVRASLEKMVKGGNIPHALLFAGPKGTGKTSAARIVAKVLNCEKNEKKLGEPCNECEQCLSIMKGSNIDVVEIDAASHRGIDDIRLLRESIKLAPSKARSKVYIIDEAHMLTLEASNALLKTLEEPPSHVYFILATTDPEKLIPTIRSRTTIINFKRASKKELTESLEKKAKGEKIKFEKKALEAIASFSDGSFRDATKILEQLIDEGIKLEFEEVKKYLDKLANFDLDNFVQALSQKDLDFLLESINKASEAGSEMELLLDKLLLRLRDELIGSLELGEESALFKRSELIQLIELLLEAKREMSSLSDFECLPLEIAIIKWCGEVEEKGEKDGSETKNEMEAEEKDKGKKVSDLKNTEPEPVDSKITEEMWRNILIQVGKVNASIEALLRAARPENFDGQTLNLSVYYKFHKEKLEDAKHRQILEMVAAKVLSRPVRVVCSLSAPPTRKVGEKSIVNSKPEAKENLVDVAKNIFGS